MFIFMNTVHERLRHLRENVKGLSLREFRARINAELVAEEQLSLGTVSNYERPAGRARRAAPRADFIAQLRLALDAVDTPDLWDIELEGLKLS